MDKLKTRLLFISLIMLALVSVSAVAAADVDDVVVDAQDDFDLSEEIVTDVEDTSDDTQDVASEQVVSNPKDQLRADDDTDPVPNEDGSSTVTAIFSYHKTNGDVANTTRTFEAPTTIGMGAFNNIIANNKGYSIGNYKYEFSHWEDEDGNEITDGKALEKTGYNYTVVFTAIYDEYPPSVVTFQTHIMSSSGPKINNRTFTLSKGGGQAVSHKQLYELTTYIVSKTFTYAGKSYVFDHWEDEDGNIVDSVQLNWTGEDYTFKLFAVYNTTPSDLTVNWEMESPNGVVKESETKTVSEDAPITITMDDFDAKIAPYKSFNVGTGEDTKHYEFDHWEDAKGNVISEDQILQYTGQDYSVKYIAKYTVSVPTSNVTVVFIKKDENGDVISNESNVLEPGMTWIINSTTFENQISNYKEFDLNNVHYDFTHWEDEEGNEVTGPQTFEWTGDNYTKTYIAKYEGIAPAHVTIIFNNMSVEGAVSTNESNDIYQGMTWTINSTAFDNKIANYRNFTYNGKFYNFTHWVDEDGNEVTEPQTFEWADHNYTVTYTAVYEEFSLSNVTLIFTNMSEDGNKVTTNESNVLEPGVSWTIEQGKFDNQIANYREFDDDKGVHYEFVQWVDEEGNPVSLPQTFEWTGEDQTYTYIAQYKLTKPSNVTIFFVRMSSQGENVYNDSSNIIGIGKTWTITEGKFNNRIYGFTDFYYDGAHYVFNHWENETGDTVTEQTFVWTGEDYNRTFTAIYDIYPDCNITVIWDMESSDGPVSTNDSKIVRHPDGKWNVSLSTFDKQLPEKEFNYSGYHYVFDHWVDEEGNEVTENPVLPWKEANYTVKYTAVYIKTLILETSVSNESASDKPGKPVTVDFTVNDENGDPVPNGTLTVTVDGTEYSVNVTDGKATFENIVLPDTPGEYLYDVTYSGTDYYYPSVGQLNLTVQKVDVIVTLPEVINYTGSVVDIVVDVVDEFGKIVNEGTITLTIDWGTKLSEKLMATAETHTAEVINGKATFNGITLGDPGTYPSKAEYSGTDYYNEAENESDVVSLPLDTTTSGDDVSGKAGDKKDITVDIVDQNGKPVKNGTAVLKVNGKEYTAEVVDGKATFKNVELPEKSTDATVEYLGNDYYNPSNTTIKITIIPDEIVPDDNTTDEPVTPTAAKAVPVIPAAGNPLALAVFALLTLVSTVSLGKK